MAVIPQFFFPDGCGTLGQSTDGSLCAFGDFLPGYGITKPELEVLPVCFSDDCYANPCDHVTLLGWLLLRLPHAAGLIDMRLASLSVAKCLALDLGV